MNREMNSDKYIFDAGVIYKDVTFATDGSFEQYTYLGETSGGTTLTIEQEYRDIEVDGRHVATKDGVVKVTESAMISTSIKTANPENLKMALIGAIDTSNLNYDIITSKQEVESTDYITNVVLVARYGKDNPLDLQGKLAIVVLDNVLNMNGLNMEMADDGEAVFEVELKAHADSNILDTRITPFEIRIPNPKYGISMLVDGLVSEGDLISLQLINQGTTEPVGNQFTGTVEGINVLIQTVYTDEELKDNIVYEFEVSINGTPQATKALVGQKNELIVGQYTELDDYIVSE